MTFQKYCWFSFLLLLISLQLGASAVYFGLGAFLIGSGWAFARSSEVRDQVKVCFREKKIFFIVMSAYVLIAAIAMWRNGVTSPESWGELKWIPILLCLIGGVVAMIRNVEIGSITSSRIAFWALAGITLFSCIAAVYQFITGDDPFRQIIFGKGGWHNRGHGLLRNPVPFAKLMGSLCLIAFSGYLISRLSKNRRWMMICFILAMITGAAMVSSMSRGAWLSLGCVGVLGIFAAPKIQRKHWLAIFLVAAGLVLTAVFSIPLLRDRMLTIFSDTHHGSNRIRIEQWHCNWIILKENPFGVGFDGNDIREEEIYERLGYELPLARGHCHNEFLEISSATGWPGVLCYLFLTGIMLWWPWKALRGIDWESDLFRGFLLLSALLVQVFLNLAVITDQMDTQARMVMNIAWVFVLVTTCSTASRKLAATS